MHIFLWLLPLSQRYYTCHSRTLRYMHLYSLLRFDIDIAYPLTLCLEQDCTTAEARMSSEREKMLRGDLYDAGDAELVEARLRARDLLLAYNSTSERMEEQRAAALKQLIPHSGEGIFVQAPFFCDYGSNITVGDNVYFNFNCVILDVAPVHIGSNTFFGPGVQVYTATHPLNAKLRVSGQEFGKPVTIGANVWVGGGAIINPGITIGDNAVIGSGSVVTKDVPNDVIVAGNPAKFVKQVPPDSDAVS